ncbi:MAG: amino acid permease [Cytophagaceae bacterium]
MQLKTLFRKKDIERTVNDVLSQEVEEKLVLHRSLRLKDLTAFGIAAIIGAGIFSTIGEAAASGGPAVSLLFVFTAFACLFSALCYAQFASGIPVAGSAYTYSYVAFGEIIAWIIGWDLLMEYAVGNIAVAISWSGYFTTLMDGLRLTIPPYLTTDFSSAKNAYQEYLSSQGNVPAYVKQGYMAWTNAPQLAGIKIILNLPAFFINVFITILVYIGIRESKTTSNILVGLKILIILMFIGVGFFYVDSGNWSPFAPNGTSGVLQGVAAVFFAYIGFDAISTTAEESINPQKDLPRSMILSLIICTILYVAVTFVLTGMVNYSELAVDDPLAYAFSQKGLTRLSGLIAFSAVIAMASVLLVFQVGQPRIWMAMSRDGLLPSVFARIHPKFRTPSFSTIVTGILVGVPALFTNLSTMTELTSIGTLFAFVVVCAGVLALPKSNHQPGTFKIPYFNAAYFIPPLLIITISLILYIDLNSVKQFLAFTEWEIDKHKIPLAGFFIAFGIIAYYSFIKKLSLIPVLGLIINLYLMAQLEITNWLRFLIWLAVGFIVYFFYGIKNSKLRN